MAKCSIVIEWDSEEDEVSVLRNINGVTMREVTRILLEVAAEIEEAEWSKHVIS